MKDVLVNKILKFLLQTVCSMLYGKQYLKLLLRVATLSFIYFSLSSQTDKISVT